MTPEQFVYWLTGFLKGMKFGNDKLPLAQILEEELKKISFESQKFEIVSSSPSVFPKPPYEIT
jgi:hypothetical protein